MRPEAAIAREGAPPATERLRPGSSSLPDQRTLLSWLFVGRLVALGRHPARRRSGLDRAAAGVVPRHRRGPVRADVHRLRRVDGLRPEPAAGQYVPAGPGDGGPGRRHHHRPFRRPAAVGVPGALRAGRGRVRAAHAAGLGRGHGDPGVGALPGRGVHRPRRPSRTRRSGPRWSCSTWCSRSSRCWATGCARRGWSRRRSPPSSSGSGSRPTTSCGTSGPGCSRSTGSGGSPSSIRRGSGCSTSTARS